MTTTTATQIKLTVKMDSLNAAFQDGNHKTEIARILRKLADAVEIGAEGRFNLYDVNGNGIGGAFLEVWEV